MFFFQKKSNEKRAVEQIFGSTAQYISNLIQDWKGGLHFLLKKGILWFNKIIYKLDKTLT